MEQEVERDSGVGVAAENPDLHQPATQRQAAQVARQVLATDEVNHRVHAGPGRKVQGLNLEVGGPVVDHSRRSQALHVRRPLGRGCCVDARAQRYGDLHRG